MREIKKLMINMYNIKKLGYDFMGYKVNRASELSFHHLVIPKIFCHDAGIGDGYLLWNGAILVRDTSHEYLHLIEHKDEEIFARITSEMIDENLKGHLDVDNLKRIHNMLVTFEREHRYDRSKKGKILVKEDYLNNRLKF